MLLLLLERMMMLWTAGRNGQSKLVPLSFNECPLVDHFL